MRNQIVNKWIASGLVLAALFIAAVIIPFAEKSSAAVDLTTPELLELAVVNGELNQETADLYLAYALTEHEKLPQAYKSQKPWSGTLPLLRLREALPTMKPTATRIEIERLLTGTCSSSNGPLSNVTNSTYFHIEYNSIDGGLAIGNYSTSLDVSWDVEVNDFGWAAPPVLISNPPPGNRYHVIIDSLGSGLYGFVTTNGAHAGFVGNNPNTTWNDQDAYATCMVLNNDYSAFPGSAQAALDATTAHEFGHSVQFGYGAITGGNAPDDNFVEGGATWIEDEVFDNSNDNYNYLWPQFDVCMGEYTGSPYSYWITFRGLTEQFGAGTAGDGEDVMQDFWENVSASGSNNMLDALNDALINKGTNLADAYHDYAIAVKFNQSCGGGYTYPHCFEEGADYVSAAGSTSVHGSINSVGGQYTGFIEDHYALNWVSMPTSGSPYTATLQVPGGTGQLRGSLVCDTGSSLDVTPFSAVVSSGTPLAFVSNYETSGCNSVVAVITNQAQSSPNPNSCSDQTYTLEATTEGLGPNEPPIVNAGNDQTVDEGDIVSFNGTYTDTISTGNNAVIFWEFGDGDVSTGTLTPTHVYADNGLFTATLTVTNTLGTAGSDDVQITVNNVAPIVNAGSNQTVNLTQSVIISATFSDPGIDDTHMASIDWGDGTAPETAMLDQLSTVITGTHMYAAVGSYTVSVTVTDDDLDSSTDTLTVDIIESQQFYYQYLPIVEQGAP